MSWKNKRRKEKMPFKVDIKVLDRTNNITNIITFDAVKVDLSTSNDLGNPLYPEGLIGKTTLLSLKFKGSLIDPKTYNHIIEGELK